MPKQPEPENAPAAPVVYRATSYHEIAVGDGVKRADVGSIVMETDGDINVYPPEIFAAEFPDVTDIPDQPEE